MKVVLANAKPFGLQFAITIQTGGHILFFGIQITARIPNQTKWSCLQFCLVWDCGGERVCSARVVVSCMLGQLFN